MCESDHYITLYEAGNTEIIYCKCCKSFTLMHGSACAAFKKEELVQFLEVLESLRAPAFLYSHAGHRKAMVLRPNANIGFCITEEEVSDPRFGIKEALTLFEAFEIIYH